MKRKNIEKMKKEANQKWENPRKYYLNSFLNHESLQYCPECGGEIEYSSEDEDEAYCTKCGLITSGNYPYVAGIHIIFPYGIRL
jgi:NADH pyrophosphatase NudC (nudix superfamily)